MLYSRHENFTIFHDLSCYGSGSTSSVCCGHSQQVPNEQQWNTCLLSKQIQLEGWSTACGLDGVLEIIAHHNLSEWRPLAVFLVFVRQAICEYESWILSQIETMQKCSLMSQMCCHDSVQLIDLNSAWTICMMFITFKNA